MQNGFVKVICLLHSTQNDGKSVYVPIKHGGENDLIGNYCQKAIAISKIEEIHVFLFEDFLKACYIMGKKDLDSLLEKLGETPSSVEVAITSRKDNTRMYYDHYLLSPIVKLL